jgi:malate dehydrogenase (oxaloacetate-decarboxylating)(NADP+)
MIKTSRAGYQRTARWALAQSLSKESTGGNFSTNHGQKYPKPLRTKQYGIDVLHDPLWNKSSAFDYSERDRLGLRGLLPPTVRTLEDQVARVIKAIRELPDTVAQNLFLQNLHNRNETLFHRVIVDYIEEVAPLVYTPTVGVVCQRFGSQFHRSRGMYFSTEDRGKFSSMVYNWPHDDVRVIVVTDGSRILGLGDLGCHGMGIPIGKLALYCAAGGLAPHRVLPITLDVGTNNEELLNSPDYLGVRHKRLDDDEYYEFVDEFMGAVFARWPQVVVQFEDFETSRAVPLLEKYRERCRVFNDDIQGTGAVTLAGIISAANHAGKDIKDLKFMCVGAGSAGLGVCTQLVKGLVAAGLTEAEAMSKFVVCTVEGSLGKPNPARPTNHVTDITRDWINEGVDDGLNLQEVMETFKPDVLLGLTAAPGIFTESLVTTMGKQCEKPIIMPMSNPTSR